MESLNTAQPVRKRGRPTEDERVERRTQILEAALPIFLEYGFGDTTVDQLAAAARVTKRTLYNYFGNKAGVFTEMQRRLASMVSGDAPAHDTLESLATRIVLRLHSAEMIGLHRLVIAESLRFPELARNLYDNGDLRHISRLADLVRAEWGLNASSSSAAALFSLLLGEDYRRRLLGLIGPATTEEAARHALTALTTIGTGRGDGSH
ncbi:TetR/AcrR family transcriptional regulator [Cryobacterium algoritolerans]|uniref:TetR/AcrR family transcriptional regulator n=1 Tax=Cryobacterium algoritolerans TaxID=1259184 RepID=A0A4R8WRY8_9MICO|nr:TetR/AcrR family transcriptional regulator [Cryobacterium algoritolerans]TFC13243.1 TetR/AcrR family transcriptional regulator [Cryobacterium algoritolerans]